MVIGGFNAPNPCRGREQLLTNFKRSALCTSSNSETGNTDDDYAMFQEMRALGPDESYCVDTFDISGKVVQNSNYKLQHMGTKTNGLDGKVSYMSLWKKRNPNEDASVEVLELAKKNFGSLFNF